MEPAVLRRAHRTPRHAGRRSRGTLMAGAGARLARRLSRDAPRAEHLVRDPPGLDGVGTAAAGSAALSARAGVAIDPRYQRSTPSGNAFAMVNGTGAP